MGKKGKYYGCGSSSSSSSSSDCGGKYFKNPHKMYKKQLKFQKKMLKRGRCVCGFCPIGTIACDTHFMNRYSAGHGNRGMPMMIAGLHHQPGIVPHGVGVAVTPYGHSEPMRRYTSASNANYPRAPSYSQPQPLVAGPSTSYYPTGSSGYTFASLDAVPYNPAGGGVGFGDVGGVGYPPVGAGPSSYTSAHYPMPNAPGGFGQGPPPAYPGPPGPPGSGYSDGGGFGGFGYPGGMPAYPPK